MGVTAGVGTGERTERLVAGKWPSGNLWVCSAGLKNTVLADCCERKILFWQDVNSDSVSWLASQPAGLKPAEHAHPTLPRVRPKLMPSHLTYYIDSYGA